MRNLFILFIIVLAACIYQALRVSNSTHERALAIKEDRAIQRDIERSIAMTSNVKREQAVVVAEMTSRSHIRKQMENQNLHTPRKEEVALLKEKK